VHRSCFIVVRYIADLVFRASPDLDRWKEISSRLVDPCGSRIALGFSHSLLLLDGIN